MIYQTLKQYETITKSNQEACFRERVTRTRFTQSQSRLQILFQIIIYLPSQMVTATVNQGLTTGNHGFTTVIQGLFTGTRLYVRNIL